MFRQNQFGRRIQQIAALRSGSWFGARRRLHSRSLHCEALEDRRLLAITVDTLIDELDGSIEDGDISLRDAIAASATGETIDFDASLDGGTILLTLGELAIDRSMTIDATTLPTGLTIDAAGNDPTPEEDNGDGSRIFNIDDGDAETDSPANINGLTLTGGDVDTNADGGAVHSQETLTVTSSTISGNSVADGRGGGIYASGDVTVANSKIPGNHAGGWHSAGGGIWAYGNVKVTSSTVSENTIGSWTPSGSGGGVFSHGNVAVTNSTISGNSCKDGGGVYAGGDAAITSSTISRNLASNWYGYGSGGGIRARSAVTITDSTVSENSAVYGGGGILADGHLTITSSVISGNRAGHKGGGVWASGDVTVTSSTISGNETEHDGGGILATGEVSMTIENSIIAGNSDSGTAPDIAPGTGGLDVRYSLIGDKMGTDLAEAPVTMPDANGNMIGGPIRGVIDPLLWPLADNGGPTKTHALQPGGPAIDAGDPDFGGGSAFDQRGVPFVRVSGGRIDMGSFERQPIPVPPVDLVVDTLVDEIDIDFSDGDLSLREALFIANFRSGADTITFDTSLNGGTIALVRGEVGIFDAVTIDATQLVAGITIDASGTSRVFNIDDGDDGTDSPVTIRGLTLTDGYADRDGGAIRAAEDLTITSSTISGNETGNSGSGGGIWASGELTVTSSMISGNSASDGGGIWASGDVTVTFSTISRNWAGGRRGGGISAGRNVTVISSKISGNGAAWYGGGVHAEGNVTITSTAISGNSASVGVGGIWAVGDVTVTSSTISGNIADGGGGGIGAHGNVTVTSSTISGNYYVAGYGGGIQAQGDVTVTSSMISGNSAFIGGGIWAVGEVTVTSSTISGNDANIDPDAYYGGGGIRASGNVGNVTITSSTISGNSAFSGGGISARNGNITLDNAIVAGNTDAGTAPDICPGTGPLTVRFSLIGDNTGSGLAEAPVGMPDANGNLIGDPNGMGIIDPMLGPLTDNGGPTETHALLAGSPVIDTGDPDFVPPPIVDQRGIPRVADGNADGVARIDMGAFEVLRGDLNNDGEVNGLDVDPFVRVLLNGPPTATADVNADGRVNGLDVDRFVAEVVGDAIPLEFLNMS